MLSHITENTTAFIKKYSLFVASVLLLLLFIFILFFSYTSAPKKTSTSSPQKSTTFSPSPAPKEGLESSEKDIVLWTPQSFSESDFGDINIANTTLPDGSVQYSYPSSTPNRPNIIFVKNGVNIFQRTPMYNTSIDNPTESGKGPEYVATGSYFWGQSVVIDIYLSRGFAYVVDPNKNQVLEQMIFQPVSKDEFKKVYPTDIIGDLQQQFIQTWSIN